METVLKAPWPRAPGPQLALGARAETAPAASCAREVRTAGGEEPTCRAASRQRGKEGWALSCSGRVRPPAALAPAPLEVRPPPGRRPLAPSECPLRRGQRTRRGDLAMAGTRRLLCLWLGCCCVSLARGAGLQPRVPELRKAAPGDRAAGGGPGPLLRPRDKVSEHMLRLYDRYSGGGRAEAAGTPGPSERGSQPLRPQLLREGNTVRSFRAAAAGECPRSTPFCGPAPALSPDPPQPPHLP